MMPDAVVVMMLYHYVLRVMNGGMLSSPYFATVDMLRASNPYNLLGL